jgi:hypothetical protein
MISTQGSYISNISQLHYGRRMPYVGLLPPR